MQSECALTSNEMNWTAIAYANPVSKTMLMKITQTICSRYPVSSLILVSITNGQANLEFFEADHALCTDQRTSLLQTINLNEQDQEPGLNGYLSAGSRR